MISILASFHQGNASLFGNNAGFQCTAVALAAIILASYFPVAEWQTSTLNDALFYGDSLYTSTIYTNYNGRQVYLMPSDLPRSVQYQDRQLEVVYHTDEIHGITNIYTSGGTQFLANPLDNGLQLAFSISDFSLLTVGQLTVALVHDSIHGTYHVIDSHSRDSFGNPSTNGAAVLLTFANLQDLCEYIQKTYINQLYNLTPVSLSERRGIHIDYAGTNKGVPDSQPSMANEAQSSLIYQDQILAALQTVNKLNSNTPGSCCTSSQNYTYSEACPNSCDDTYSTYTSYSATRTLENEIDTCSTSANDTNCMNCDTVTESSIRAGLYLHNHTYSHSFGNRDNVPVQLNMTSEINETNADLFSYTRSIHNLPNVQSLSSLPNHFQFSQSTGNTISPERMQTNIQQTEISDQDHCLLNTDKESDEATASKTHDLKKASAIDMSCSRSISSAFIKDIQKLPDKICTSCKCFLFAKDIVKSDTSYAALDIREGVSLCRKCLNQLKKNSVPKASYVHNKLDAGIVPSQLKNLFVVEKRLISLIPVFLTLIVLPGGQFAQHGIAVNIPINMNEQLTLLHSSSNEKNSLLISFERPNNCPVTLPIRLSVLYNALLWLKTNNHLYANVDLSGFESSFSPLTLAGHNTSELSTDIIEEEFGLTVKDSFVPDNSEEDSQQVSTANNSQNPASCIPVATQKPVNIKEQPFGEEKAFPWLFPSGVNGLGSRRSIPLTDLSYFHSRLYNHDPRWRCDIPYVMSSLNLHEWSLLTSLVSTYMRTQKPVSGQSRGFVPITAEDVNNVRNDPVMMQNSYMFTKHIRGTAAYWKSVLLQLLAMVKSLGPPTFFVTLSCNDNWPELQAFLNLNKNGEKQFVKDDPLMTALAFEQRWHALLKHVIKKKEPLGRVLDMFTRVEFQARGAAHLHIFLWTDLGDALMSGSAENIINVIDRTICTKLPDKETDSDMHRLVSVLQVHKHSFTCQKGRRRCRFDFPRRACMRTKLCFDPDVILHHRGRFYETARQSTDLWVNAYNPVILQHWRANMDIQLVGNAESCAFYVCKYICKAEPEELRETLQALFENADFQSSELRKRLIMIGTCILKKRKISAQEAMYRLGGLKLYQSSRQVLSINTLPKIKRFKLIKPKAQREHLPPDCTDEHALFESNMIDYYRARPSALENYSLHEFASWYTRDSSGTKLQTASSKLALPRIHLLPPYQEIVFRKRRTSVVVKPCKIKQSSDDYYYSCLLLFLPHRTEANLLIPFVTYRSSFVGHFTDLDPRYKNIQSISSELEEAVRRIHLLNLHTDFLENDMNSETITSSNQSDFSFLVPPEAITHTFESTTASDQIHFDTNQSDDLSWHSLSACTMGENALETRLSCLSPDQRSVLSIIQRHFQESTDGNRLYLFCSGGAGTGKSFLLTTIVEWLRLCHPKQPGCNSVVVAAPTGVAARNVQGYTLHSIFKLPVQHGYEPEFHELSAFALKKLRDMFKTIHTIIIDEISMVSRKYFHYIHQRLCSIANNDQPFGNFNVLLFGDFYQLRPVRGHYVFTDNILWPLFTPRILCTNKRQLGDNRFISLLNRVRLGDPSAEDITLLHSKLIPYPSESKKHLLHIFPKNKQVRAHNSYMQRQLPGELHTFSADHTFSQYDLHPGLAVPSRLIPEDDKYAGGLPIELQVSVGTRVMLLRNLVTREGLVNGAMGTVTHIELGQNGTETQIYVRFDDTSVGQTFQSSSHGNSIPISRYTQEYLYLGRYINRVQFPLTPCWACTVHKLQGISVDAAVIYLGLDIFQAGQAYVALSRIRSLDGIYLTSLCVQRIYADATVMEEYVRLMQIARLLH